MFLLHKYFLWTYDLGGLFNTKNRPAVTQPVAFVRNS